MCCATSDVTPSSRGRARLGPVVLIAALAAGCSSGDDAAPLPPAASAGVYSEIRDFDAVEAQLGLLQSRGLGLVQVMAPSDFGSPALRSLIEASASAGVEFRAWVVLPEAEGYWPGESNVVAFGEAVDELLSWIEAEALPVGWITVDMEPSFAYTDELLTIARDESNPDRISELVALVQSHHDPAAFAVATEGYQGIVERIHEAGLRAHVVTYPMVLDDLGDGDRDIQDGLDIPVEGIDWDELSFMVYRSAMQVFVEGELDVGVFYSYGLDARQRFGERAALDYGLVGTGVVTVEGEYESPAVLRSDVAAGRAAGIDRLHLYCFEGAREKADAGAWLGFGAVPPGAVPANGSSSHAIRTMFELLDGILDSE